MIIGDGMFLSSKIEKRIKKISDTYNVIRTSEEALTGNDSEKMLTEQLEKHKPMAVISLLPLQESDSSYNRVKYMSATLRAVQWIDKQDSTYIHVGDASIYGQQTGIQYRDAYHPFDPADPGVDDYRAVNAANLERQFLLHTQRAHPLHEGPKSTGRYYLLRFGLLLTRPDRYEPSSYSRSEPRLDYFYRYREKDDLRGISILDGSLQVSPVLEEDAITCILQGIMPGEKPPPGVYNIGPERPCTISSFLSTISIVSEEQLNVYQAGLRKQGAVECTFPTSNQAVSPRWWLAKGGHKIPPVSESLTKHLKGLGVKNAVDEND
jgi:hypothetical protein